MKKFLPTMIAATALVAIPSATAEGWYADGGYTLLSSDVDAGGVSADIDLGAISGRVGYDLNQNFGFEGEVAIGVDDEDFSDGVTNASIGLNYLVGAYGKAQLPVTDQFNVFARAGVVNAELEAEVTGIGSDSDSETGAGFGVGGTFDVTPAMYVRGDYTRYDIEDYEADAFTVAVGVKF